MFKINRQNTTVSINGANPIVYKKPLINSQPKIILPIQEEKQKKLIKYYQK